MPADLIEGCITSALDTEPCHQQELFDSMWSRNNKASAWATRSANDITLVPKGNVIKYNLCVCLNYAGQTQIFSAVIGCACEA